MHCFRTHAERFPAKPYIKEGFPQNTTVLVNTTAIFECPVVFTETLEPYIEFLRPLNFSTDLSEDDIIVGVVLQVPIMTWWRKHSHGLGDWWQLSYHVTNIYFR